MRHTATYTFFHVYRFRWRDICGSLTLIAVEILREVLADLHLILVGLLEKAIDISQIPPR